MMLWSTVALINIEALGSRIAGDKAEKKKK
jgi:hypothetical protein